MGYEYDNMLSLMSEGTVGKIFAMKKGLFREYYRSFAKSLKKEICLILITLNWSIGIT